MKKAVLFDFYNTLVEVRTDEHRQEVWEQLALFMRDHGLPAKADLTRERYFGLVEEVKEQGSEIDNEVDVRSIFADMIKELSGPDPDEFSIEITKLFRKLSMIRLRPFEDTVPMLTALRERFRIGLVSDAQPLYLRPELRATSLEGLIDTVVVSANYGYRKPDPRLFEIALKRLKASPAEAVYVGDDARRDVGGARAAYVEPILILRNAADLEPEDGFKPGKVIRSLFELRGILTPDKAAG